MFPQVNIGVDRLVANSSDPVMIFTNESSGGDLIEWDFGDGEIITDQIVEYTFSEIGTSCVTLTAFTVSRVVLAAMKYAYKCVPDFFVYIPNSFTPNNDGVNDYWQPQCIGAILYELKIFNRWGELIFPIQRPGIPWYGNSEAGLLLL